MNKNIMVIVSGPRVQGNSEQLADNFMKGAQDAGNNVEKVTLYDKQLQFCKGCLACQHIQNGHCVMRDDLNAIMQRMKDVDIVVFATPVYFYGMCAQLKTLLDRSNPLFPIDYTFKDIYVLCSAADEEQSAIDGVSQGVQGWISCFEGVKLKDSLVATNVTTPNDIQQHTEVLQKAYQMGFAIQ